MRIALRGEEVGARAEVDDRPDRVVEELGQVRRAGCVLRRAWPNPGNERDRAHRQAAVVEPRPLIVGHGGAPGGRLVLRAIPGEGAGNGEDREHDEREAVPESPWHEQRREHEQQDERECDGKPAEACA